MEICEFKAWFEGFTEDMNGQPTAKQWKRIKARVKQVDGTPTTERVFIDRYWDRYQPYWTYTDRYLTGYPTSNVPVQLTSAVSYTAGDGCSTNINQAFTALGKAEAASIGFT